MPKTRVRTALVLGTVTDIGWYFGDVFCCETQYKTDQTAVSTAQMIIILTSAIWLVNDGSEGVSLWNIFLSDYTHSQTFLRGLQCPVVFMLTRKR